MVIEFIWSAEYAIIPLVKCLAFVVINWNQIESFITEECGKPFNLTEIFLSIFHVAKASLHPSRLGLHSHRYFINLRIKQSTFEDLNCLKLKFQNVPASYIMWFTTTIVSTFLNKFLHKYFKINDKKNVSLT